MIPKLWLTFLLFILSSLLVACGDKVAPNPDAGDTLGLLSGSVAYRERIALPRDAIITVQLLDVSTSDAPTVVAEQKIRPSQEIPIPFTLQFDRSQINRSGIYGVAATISMEGEAAWQTSVPTLVLTNGNPSEDIAIVLERTP